MVVYSTSIFQTGIKSWFSGCQVFFIFVVQFSTLTQPPDQRLSHKVLIDVIWIGLKTTVLWEQMVTQVLCQDWWLSRGRMDRLQVIGNYADMLATRPLTLMSTR